MTIICLSSIIKPGHAETPLPNEQARFLAGLSVSDTALKLLASGPAWLEHERAFQAAWSASEKSNLKPLRTWAEVALAPSTEKAAPVYYMFAGPDFLHAHKLFPDAAEYLLCGLEPIGTLPDVTHPASNQVDAALPVLRKSFRSALGSSYFQTKEMELDLRAGILPGVLPLFYVTLARCDCIIIKVKPIWLDNSGMLVLNRTRTPGVKIVFRRHTNPLQTLYYFQTDLRDEATAESGFLKWCETFDKGIGIFKATTYLTHHPGFNSVRKLILSQSRVLVQDDSGIPMRFLQPLDWDVRCYGTYSKPIAAFDKHFQPELSKLYRDQKPLPLPFGFGYKSLPAESGLVIAFKNQR